MHPSVHRVGLAAAALAAILSIGGTFAVDGYLAAHGSAPGGAASPTIASAVTPTAAPSLPPEIVYVRPAPSPRVIHVTQTAPPAAPKVVHVTVPGPGGEAGEGSDGPGGEHDGGGD